MARSNVRWEGKKAFEKMTEILPSKIGGQKLRKAYKFALMPTKKKMKDNIPKGRTGALWYSVDTSIGGAKDIQSMFGIVGPRRKKNTWNMKGWHSHLYEAGVKPHVIKAKTGKGMPVFVKGASGPVGYAKEIKHPGYPGRYPFKKAIDSTWKNVGIRVSDKVAEIMRDEIKDINNKYGSVATR